MKTALNRKIAEARSTVHMLPNERCRVLVDGKYQPAICLRAHSKSIRVKVGDVEKLVPHVAVWKQKKSKKAPNVGCRSIEKLPTRKGRFRRQVRIVPVRFRHGVEFGDYGRMMKNPGYMASGVMGFNDNDGQWQRFLNTKAHDFAGGGNAIAREVQASGDAIGIPTGPYSNLAEQRTILFPEDDGVPQTRTAAQIIDRAFIQIRDLFLARPDKDVFYYSAEDDNDNIGLRIFAGMVGDDVVQRITQKIKELPEAIQAARFA